MSINWNEALVRASCASKVMTDGRGSVLTEKQSELLDTLLEKGDSATDKQKITIAELIAKRDAPITLSDTCTSYLKEVYVFHKYGKDPVGGSRRSQYTEKGKSVEDESIQLLSRIDSADYKKNDERKNNAYFTGECDIVVNSNKLIDIKSSWDFSTMLSVIGKPLNVDYWWQGQVYLDLWGAKDYEVCYCLVNMPQEMVEWEKLRIFKIMNPVSEESPDYARKIEKLEHDMTFDEVDIRERVVRFPFSKDQQAIDKLKGRWDDCRKWLEEFENIHTSLNK